MDELTILAGILVLLAFLSSSTALQKSTQVTLLDELSLITGMGGTLEVANARLFVSNIPFDPKTSVLADFVAVAAAWTGSASKLVVWGSPFIQSNGFPTQESQLLNYICSAAPGAPAQNFGVFYDDGVLLLGVDYFPTPQLVTNALDNVQWVANAP